MKPVIIIAIAFVLFIPLSSYSQSDQVSLEEIQNLPESIESTNEKNQKDTMLIISNFNQTSARLSENLLSILTANQDADNLTNTILKDIETLLKKNQLRSEETQLANSLIQVSGIFIAIIGGFLTTKILSLGTERNRIRRKLSEIESEISNTNTVIRHYRDIVNDLGTSWATEDINDFRQKILNESTLKEFSKEELIKKYEEDEGRSANQHEKQVFDAQYAEIISEIKSKLKGKDSPFKISSNSGGMFPPRRDNDLYNDSEENLKFEESNVSHLEDQRSILEDDLTDLQSPNIWTTGIIFLSLAVFLGIILPSVSQFFTLGNPSVAALVGFLTVFMLFLFYIVFEFRRTLQIIQIQMEGE